MYQRYQKKLISNRCNIEASIAVEYKANIDTLYSIGFNKKKLLLSAKKSNSRPLW